jgi:hypothetical protein
VHARAGMKPEKRKPSSAKAKRAPTSAGVQRAKAATAPSGANTRRDLTKTALENSRTRVDERAAKARASTEAAGVDHDRLQEIYRLFLKTPEAHEHRAAVEKANDALSGIDAEWPVVEITIEIPQPFVDLFTYIERLNARDAGRAPENIATLVEQDVHNEMHQRLHWLSTEPQVFEHYRNMFNRFCVENGWQEYQIKERPKAGEEDGSSGSF